MFKTLKSAVAIAVVGCMALPFTNGAAQAQSFVDAVYSALSSGVKLRPGESKVISESGVVGPDIEIEFQRYEIAASAGGGKIRLTANLDVPSADVSHMTDTVMGEDFFWASRYQSISFQGSADRARLVADGDGRAKLVGTGTLTLRGVSRQERITFIFDCNGRSNCPSGGMNVTARMTIDRTNYGMTSMTLLVDEDVEITASGLLR